MEILELEGPFLVAVAHARARVHDLVRRSPISIARPDGVFGDVMVGRCSSAHVRVLSRSVSLVHAILRPFPGGFVQLIDRGSTNGTFVNGERLEPGVPVTLREGSIVRFGNKKYAFGSKRLQAILRGLVSRRAS